MSSLSASHRRFSARVGLLGRLLTLLFVLALPLALAGGTGSRAAAAATPTAHPVVLQPLAAARPGTPPSAQALGAADWLHTGGIRSVTAAPNASVTASPAQDSVSAYGFTPSTAVTFTIRSAPGGTVLATGMKVVSEYGWAGFFRPADHDVDLVAGMQVAVSDGTTTKELTLALLAITAVDPVHDTVAGTTSPGGQVYVYAYRNNSYSPTLVATAGPGGTWTLDFSGSYDITALTNVFAAVHDGDGDETTHFWRPAIVTASITSDYLWADGFAAAGTVTFTLRASPGGTVVATGTKAADGSGSVSFYRNTDHTADLRPGQELTVTDGTTTKTLVLANLQVTSIDTAADRIAGVAPAGAVVEAYVYGYDGSASTTKTAIAASDGTWTIDFAGSFDIDATATANAIVRDDDGDVTQVYKQPAILTAELAYDTFAATGFGPGTTLTYTLRSAPGGSVLGTGSKTADDWGYAWFNPGIDLVPGQQLTVTDGATTKELAFVKVTITSIDTAADVVNGTAPAGARVEVRTYTGSMSVGKTVTTAGDGTWQADFSATVDLGYGTSASAIVRDADGDATNVNRGPSLLSASLNTDYAFASGFAPETTVTFTVRQSPGGAVVASGGQKTTASGYASFATGVDLVAGMEITATDGGVTKVLTLAPLVITAVDGTADTVSGTAAPGTHVSVYAYGPVTSSPTRDVVAGSDGTWTADFSGAFELVGATVYASVRDADGDATEVSRQWPTIWASLATDSATASGFMPNATITVTVRSGPGGSVLDTASKQADRWGYAWFSRYDDLQVDLVAGRQLTVTDGTITKTLTLSAVTVGSVDRETDVVTGTAPAGAAVEVRASDESNLGFMTTADGTGAWRADFSGLFDIGWRTTVTATVRDDDGDSTGTTKTPTLVMGSLTDDYVQLAGFVTDGEVTVTVRSSGGIVLYSGVASTDGTGWALVSHETIGVDLVPGVRVSVTDGTDTKELTLAPLAILGVDPAADTVTGTAPPGAQVELYVVGSPGTRDVTAGADGHFTADFTGVFDVPVGAQVYASVHDADEDTTVVSWHATDTQAPRIEAPDAVAADATSPTGAAVSFTVTADDAVDPSPTVTCTPASGSTFPIGDTTVACKATDASGNRAAASFVVHVRGAGEQLARLRAAVTAVGPGASLAGRLDAVTKALAAGDRARAHLLLDAFVNQVRAQAGKSIGAASAAKLIADAERIQAVIRT